MGDQDFARVEQAFQAVLAARAAGGDAPDVTALCEGDTGLADEVRSLLKHWKAAGEDAAATAATANVAAPATGNGRGFLDPAELHGARAAAGLADRRAMLDEWGVAAVG